MLVDDFMSTVKELNEKEKEETILFLAEALINDNYEFLKKISPKVQDIVLPFLTAVNFKSLKDTAESLKILEGGKNESNIHNKKNI